MYLTERESRRLAELVRSADRSQAQIVRHAINSYMPVSQSEGDFAFARGFARIDGSPRALSEMPDEDLLDGSGQ